MKEHKVLIHRGVGITIAEMVGKNTYGVAIKSPGDNRTTDVDGAGVAMMRLGAICPSVFTMREWNPPSFLAERFDRAIRACSSLKDVFDCCQRIAEKLSVEVHCEDDEGGVLYRVAFPKGLPDEAMRRAIEFIHWLHCHRTGNNEAAAQGPRLAAEFVGDAPQPKADDPQESLDKPTPELRELMEKVIEALSVAREYFTERLSRFCDSERDLRACRDDSCDDCAGKAGKLVAEFDAVGEWARTVACVGEALDTVLMGEDNGGEKS